MTDLLAESLASAGWLGSDRAERTWIFPWPGIQPLAYSRSGNSQNLPLENTSETKSLLYMRLVKYAWLKVHKKKKNKRMKPEQTASMNVAVCNLTHGWVVVGQGFSELTGRQKFATHLQVVLDLGLSRAQHTWNTKLSLKSRWCHNQSDEGRKSFKGSLWCSSIRWFWGFSPIRTLLWWQNYRVAPAEQ